MPIRTRQSRVCLSVAEVFVIDSKECGQLRAVFLIISHQPLSNFKRVVSLSRIAEARSRPNLCLTWKPAYLLIDFQFQVASLGTEHVEGVDFSVREPLPKWKFGGDKSCHDFW